MGNRVVVVFHNEEEVSPIIYLHWNGGPESIYAFLDELKRRKCRVEDVSYCSARFVHIVGDFFDQREVSPNSLGIYNGPSEITKATLRQLNDMYGPDNGVYAVSYPNDKRVVRRFTNNKEQNAAWVSKERKAAYASGYHDKQTGIPATFARLRPFIEDDGGYESSLTATFDKAVLHWNDGTVAKLIKAIWDEYDWNHLPLLGDALEQAGEGSQWLLDKLRSNVCHSREEFALLLKWGK